MNYQDFCTLSEKEYAIMKQNYDTLILNETADLQEILQKMIEQRENLSNLNDNERYNDILQKLDENIKDLESLIVVNKSNISSKDLLSKLPYLKGLKKAKKLDEPQAISPIRSNDEINRHNEMSGAQPSSPLSPNQTPSNNDAISPILSDENNLPNMENSGNTPNIEMPDNAGNVPTETPANPPITNTPSNETNMPTNENTNMPTNEAPMQNESVPNSTPTQNTNKRNSPMQSNPISNFIKQFNVNISKMFGGSRTNGAQKKDTSPKKCETNNQNFFQPYTYPDLERPFERRERHRDFREHCDPRNEIKHHQIDIIRLFLLYLMLRPNCKYMSRVAQIANDQFDILLMVME